VHQIKCLSLSVRKMASRTAMRNYLRSSRRELQGRSPPIESYEAPEGRLPRGRRGFSPSGFPLHVIDYGPSHHPSIRTHRRWGSFDSRGTAADRDRQGGDHTGFEGGNRWEVGAGRDFPVTTSIGPSQHECEERSLGDYCYVPWLHERAVNSTQ